MTTTAKQQTIEQRFHRAAGGADVAPAVRIARGLVIETLTANTGVDLAEPGQLVDCLVGSAGAAENGQSRQFAAFVLGIAVGQLFHPDVFGGAR